MWVLAALIASAAQTARNAAQASLTPVTRIGRIHAERGLHLVDSHGQTVNNTFCSFDHFA